MSCENPNLLHLSTKPLIIFVRHPETESNQAIHASKDQKVAPDHALLKKLDPKVTPLGHEQIKITCQYLCDVLDQQGLVPEVWASPFERTRIMAQHFCELRHSFVDRIEPWLQEHIKPEVVVPESLAEAGVVASSWEEYLERIAKLEARIRAHSLGEKKCLVIFGHSLTISLLLTYIANGCQYPEDGKVQVSFHIPNCSISVGRIDAGQWNIYQVASVAHLPRKYVSGIHTLLGTSD